MLHLTIGTNNLVLTLQNPLELTDVTIRFTSQSTGASTSCDVATPLYDGRVFTGTISVNSPPTTSTGVDLTGPDFPQGFFLCEVLEGAVVMGSTLAYLEYEQAPISYDGTDSYLAYDYGLNCEPVTVTDGDGTLHQVSAGGTYTCISTTPPSGIAYQRPLVHSAAQTGQRRVGDQRWQFDQGLLPYPADPPNPATFQRPAIRNTYDTKFEPFALLKFNNAFGNKYRWTNTAGNQGSDSTQSYGRPQFHYMNDWAGAVKGYVIDHLTGLAWTAYAVNPPNGVRTTGTYVHSGITYTRPQYHWDSFANYAHGLNGETQFNLGGYTDWRLPTWDELQTLMTATVEVQNSFAWTGVSHAWDFQALQDWYVTRGQTGAPPRGGQNAWGSSFWGIAALYMSTYFYSTTGVTSFLSAVFVRNHY